MANPMSIFTLATVIPTTTIQLISMKLFLSKKYKNHWKILIILLGFLLTRLLKNSNVVAINGELKLGKSSMELAKIHDFIQKVL